MPVTFGRYIGILSHKLKYLPHTSISTSNKHNRQYTQDWFDVTELMNDRYAIYIEYVKLQSKNEAY